MLCQLITCQKLQVRISLSSGTLAGGDQNQFIRRGISAGMRWWPHPNSLHSIRYAAEKANKFENLAFLTGTHSCKRTSVEVFNCKTASSNKRSPLDCAGKRANQV